MSSVRKKILAISGSTRQNSTNQRLLKAIEELASDELEFYFFNGISELPHFNPDSEQEVLPKEVMHFKQLLAEADGVLICTPEYAHGVPGTLKNAIDWTVSTSEFSHKPTLLITASTDGRFGHAALLETLRVIEAENIDELQLLIQFVQTKVSKESKITDAQTSEGVKVLLHKFVDTIQSKKEKEY